MRFRPDFRAAVSLRNLFHRESGDEIAEQFLSHNTGDGTLPKAIHDWTRPKVGGVHDNLF